MKLGDYVRVLPSAEPFISPDKRIAVGSVCEVRIIWHMIRKVKLAPLGKPYEFAGVFRWHELERVDVNMCNDEDLRLIAAHQLGVNGL